MFFQNSGCFFQPEFFCLITVLFNQEEIKETTDPKPHFEGGGTEGQCVVAVSGRGADLQIQQLVNVSYPTIYKCIDKTLAAGTDSGLKVSVKLIQPLLYTAGRNSTSKSLDLQIF